MSRGGYFWREYRQQTRVVYLALGVFLVQANATLASGRAGCYVFVVVTYRVGISTINCRHDDVQRRNRRRRRRTEF